MVDRNLLGHIVHQASLSLFSLAEKTSLIMETHRALLCSTPRSRCFAVLSWSLHFSFLFSTSKDPIWTANRRTKTRSRRRSSLFVVLEQHKSRSDIPTMNIR